MRNFWIAALVVLLGVAAVAVNRSLIPKSDTAATHFDAIIVLGSPATKKGNPSNDERERVLEAIREYNAGVAPEIIMTGGPAHNQYVEAHVMAGLALRKGVPTTAVIEEPQALNTIQNIYYSTQIMHAHGWSSAEIISSRGHIARAAMILEALPKSQPALAITWRTHAAPDPKEHSWLRRIFDYSLESTRCLEIRMFGLPRSQFLPKG